MQRMPVTPKHPGVYVVEVPSSVRTITGVATAITAFVGRALRGRVDHPVRIHSYEDYTRTFGGLSLKSTVSYSVQHFFQNGGTEARVVRCYRPPSTEDQSAGANPDGRASLRLPAWVVEAQGTLTLAVNPDDNDTLTLGDLTYRFQQDLTDSAGHVQIGGRVEDSRANLVAAINGTGIPGTQYAKATVANPDVGAARSFEGSRLRLTARTGGPAGNSIVTTANFSSEDNKLDAATLGATRPGTDPSSDATPAQGTLIIKDSPPTDGDEMTIGSVTYTFRDTPSDSGDIKIEAVDATRSNVIAAINDPANGNPDVEASLEGTEIVLTARTPGSAGNEIATTANFTNANHGFDGDTLGVRTSVRDSPSFELVAADPGAWANNLQVTIDHDVANPADATTFNLLLEEFDPSLPDGAPPTRTEEYFNVSVDPDSPLFIDLVLESRSRLARIGDSSVDAPRSIEDEAMSGGSDGQPLTDAEISGSDLAAAKRGLWALEDADLFNILCVPPLSFDEGDDIGSVTREAALEYCKARRAFFIVDPPSDWISPEDAETGVDGLVSRDENAAVYFPRVRMANPLRDNQLSTFAPCGVIAGVYARTDARRGVWKAPAGTEATMRGVHELALKLTDEQNGVLNPLGVNILRTFPVIGNVVWGARTLRGADQLASEWKYVSVRRMALFIQETLFRGLQWVVFEPNDEPLWAQIRLNVGAFMHTQFRKGAFQGASPADAYLVKCDGETTTQADIDQGIVNILVGFAPLKPAEFVILRIQQLAGQQEA